LFHAREIGISMPALQRPITTSAVALAIIGLLIGCAMEPRKESPSRPAGPAPAAAASDFAGDRECARCHRKEFKQHSLTNHARTLRPMRRDRLPAEFPASGAFTDPASGAAYSMRESNGRFELSVTGSAGTHARVIDLALGAGKRGMTFLSLDGPDGMIELRMSCFPRQKKWFITPGQARPDAPAAGKLRKGQDARRCIGCHAVALPESGVAPEERLMGVGCESCHGPGKAHVAAAVANPKPGAIRSLRELGATQLNELCGKCHRTAKDIDPDNEVAAQQTQRFQPYGLMKSECFLRSGDRLSCVTCHEPHRNVDTHPATYERACLSCHGSSRRSKQHQTVCPVNPRTGCVPCHMPQRPLMPGISMADHYIRVFRGREGSAEGL
jgi:hypothetical protein